MSYKDLREFIHFLEENNLLKRVSHPVAVDLQMTEIHSRLLKTGGVAVLFEKPVLADGTISDIPVLVNLFGTVERVALGITTGGKTRHTGQELREVGQLLAFLRQPTPPAGIKEAWEMLPLAKKLSIRAMILILLNYPFRVVGHTNQPLSLHGR